MDSTHEGELDLPGLPPAARRIDLLPSLKNDTLISIGQLCDAGCTATFTKDRVTISFQGRTILVGTRDGPNKLWYLHKNTADHKANNGVKIPSFLPSSTKPADVVAFHHAALGSPVVSTLVKAINKNYLPGFPGLTTKSI